MPCLLCVFLHHVESCCITLGHAVFNNVYLLRVPFSEGQFGGNVEHDLLLSVDGVYRLRTRLTMRDIQTPSKPAQRDSDYLPAVYFLISVSSECLSGGFLLIKDVRGPLKSNFML